MAEVEFAEPLYAVLFGRDFVPVLLCADFREVLAALLALDLFDLIDLVEATDLDALAFLLATFAFEVLDAIDT